MNKKGFTIIELIAVVVIMAIIAMIATPNVITLLDNGKKSDYVADAKTFISKAKYMYKLDKYKNETYFIYDTEKKEDKIMLKNIVNINDYNDPYGGVYDSENSYVLFTTQSENGENLRVVKIYLVSGEENSGIMQHRIGSQDGQGVDEKNVTKESVIDIKQ